MTSTVTNRNTGLIGGTGWTTVSHLNGALALAALSAIHSRKLKAPRPTRPPRDPIPLRPRKPQFDTAA